MERVNQENGLVWKRTVWNLKNQVTKATTKNNSLQLEVDNLKQKKDKDQTMVVLPLNAKAIE